MTDKDDLTEEEIKHLKRTYRDQQYYSAMILGGILPIIVYSFLGVVPNIQTKLQPHMPKIVFTSVILALSYRYYELNISGDQE